MHAIILAAGFGTRLRPLTDSTPKALVSIAGRPLLDILLHRLIRAGFTEIAVNSHYLSDQIDDFLKKRRWDADIHLSHEPEILNTGGGIKKMLKYFEKDEPILVHNVDILTDLDYRAVMDFHLAQRPRATLVVQNRPQQQHLLFNNQWQFIGRAPNDLDTIQPDQFAIAFCGIQVIQPSLFRWRAAAKFYSIDLYTEAAQRGDRIIGWQVPPHTYWRDVGTHQDLQHVQDDAATGQFL